MSLLITVEGLDGCGKSTLAKSLVERLSQDPQVYPWVYLSKEPGSTWAGKVPSQLRQLVLETPDLKPFERELLFYADASIHTRFIENQQQAIIISDRGLWSHLAYLRGYLKTGQINWDDYQLCKGIINKVCRKPDCVVYLRGDLKLMRERNANKVKDSIEINGDAYFSAVLDTYEDLVVECEWTKQSLIVQDACLPQDKIITNVINYLKEGAFKDEELTRGDKLVC